MWSLISSLFYLEFLVSSGSVSLSVFVSQTVKPLRVLSYAGPVQHFPLARLYFLIKISIFCFNNISLFFLQPSPLLHTHALLDFSY